MKKSVNKRIVEKDNIKYDDYHIDISKRRKRGLYVLGILGFIIVALYVVPFSLTGKAISPLSIFNKNNERQNQGNMNQIAIQQVTKENLPIVLQSQDIVKDLPNNAIVLLKLYNFDSGERQWEESYVIKKDSVSKGGADKPDVTIIVSSKYVPYMYNVCVAIMAANKNNDLGYESDKSDAALLWEFKGMMKYKKCLS